MAEPLPEREREELVAYLDGELSDPDASRVEARISLDPAARAEAEGLRRTWALLDCLPRPEPSPAFTHQTLQRISAVRSARPTGQRAWPRRLAWVAAGLLAGALGVATGRFVPNRAAPASPPSIPDEELARDLGAVENRRLYQYVEDVGFLRALGNPNDPDLFSADDGPGS